MKTIVSREDRLCRYCKHRDTVNEVFIPVRRPWGTKNEWCAPCLKEAGHCDCGPGVHYYADDGNCLEGADAFEPGDAWWEELGRRELIALAEDKVAAILAFAR